LLKDRHQQRASTYCLANVLPNLPNKLWGENGEFDLAKQYLNLTLQETAYVLPTLPNNISNPSSSSFLVIPILPNNIFRIPRPAKIFIVKVLLSKKKHPFRSAFRLVGVLTLINDYVFLLQNNNPFNVV
jgi:hypothetical protein